MKRTAFFNALLFLCAAMVFAQNGVIRELSGTVELKPAGAGDFIAARKGDTITKDTIISTGFKSSALVEAGSSIITVRPLTRLTLAELTLSAGTETLNVNLQTGRVRVDVNPPAGTRTSMAVRGPTATASVRGTSFEFDTYTLTVLEGKVAFQNNRDYDKQQRSRESQNDEAAQSDDSSQEGNETPAKERITTKTDDGTIVKTGRVSELTPTGKVEVSTVAKNELVPEIKKDIDSGTKRQKTNETAPVVIQRPSGIGLIYGGLR